MKRALFACIAALALASVAAAQHTGSGTQVPDVPAGPGTIRGEVVNPDDPARVGDVEILLYALPPDGMPGLRRAKSDAQGKFAFEGIANDANTAYLVGARYAEIPYPGERLSFAAGETEKQVTVRVGDPTEDSRDASVVETRLEIAYAGGRLGVSELHRLENRGDKTIFVAEPQREHGKPLLRARLPEGADEFNIPLGIQPEGLIRDGLDLRFFGPLYPSSWPGPLAQDQGLAFQYTLPAASGPFSVEKQFPSGSQKVVVLVANSGPKIRIAGAREETPEAQPAGGEAPVQRLVVDRVPPGGKIVMNVDVPASRIDPDAVHLDESRVFLELDDAALSVQQEYILTVSGDMPVVGGPDAPLLSLPVPEGAQEVRFDRDAFALGLAPDEGNGAVLRGPLPPGETKLQIAYHLPVTDPDGGIAIDLRFGRLLPLLSIYAADTGLDTASDRLHRRRPVKTPDRTYIALEAFQVEPSETVHLSLAPLGAPLGLPRAALYAVVALAAGLIVSFVAAPLRAARRSTATDEATEREEVALHERDAVYAALRDLEHDHETAKLSDEDYQAMRRELRARAASLMKEQADAASAPAPAPRTAAASFCTACGKAARPDDRFCAQCGARIEAHEAQA